MVSGSGTNFQALIDAEKSGFLKTSNTAAGADGDKFGRIAAVVSDRAGVYALERAKAAEIPALVEEPNMKFSKEERREELSCRILEAAKKYQIDLIILAGFLSILSGDILVEYERRIINLHPSLLPKYGGPGMYGSRVHEAVLAAKEKESGCTVHLVDQGTDTGPILLQRKVPVLENDTAESLAGRIHKEEHIAIVEAAKLMIERIKEKSQ